ncbi:hypothetical protein VTN00DRAFT_1377 [Thermoascus crustaceus]|uniref:uncharacterized protein n=1 Tax=Thermoascus crustaceus TaxID=5088 RepID=UPI003742659E
MNVLFPRLFLFLLSVLSVLSVCMRHDVPNSQSVFVFDLFFFFVLQQWMDARPDFSIGLRSDQIRSDQNDLKLTLQMNGTEHGFELDLACPSHAYHSMSCL